MYIVLKVVCSWLASLVTEGTFLDDDWWRTVRTSGLERRLQGLFWRFVDEGRVTWHSYASWSSLPNTSSLLLTFISNTLASNDHPCYFLYKLCMVGGKTQGLTCPLGGIFPILLIQVRYRHPQVFPMEFVHLLPGVFQPLQWFPGVFIFWASCPFYKISEFFELLVHHSNISHVGDYCTFHDLSTTHSMSPVTSSGSREACFQLELSETL